MLPACLQNTFRRVEICKETIIIRN